MNAKEINFANKAGKFFIVLREDMSPRWHDYSHISSILITTGFNEIQMLSKVFS